ncbi:MAG: hypothetical protein ABIA63_05210, partial [bacterium]
MYSLSISDTSSKSELEVTGSKLFHFDGCASSGIIQGLQENINRQEALNLDIAGQLFNRIKVKGHFSDSDGDEELERTFLQLYNNNMDIFLGEFETGFKHSPLCLSRRQLVGVQLKTSSKFLETELILSRARGNAR